MSEEKEKKTNPESNQVIVPAWVQAQISKDARERRAEYKSRYVTSARTSRASKKSAGAS